MNSGYEYAKSQFGIWKKSMSIGETVKLVSHSMGGAFSKGVEKFLKENGLKVEYNVMINTYQVDEIPNQDANETIDIDYQNTDDPVLFWFDDNLGYGELENSEYKIREESNENGYLYKHRSPIDANAQRFWALIRTLLSTSNNNNNE